MRILEIVTVFTWRIFCNSTGTVLFGETVWSDFIVISGHRGKVLQGDEFAPAG